jgi:DNA adenine methylase
MDPILKWAGGKRKLLSKIKNLIDINHLRNHTLYEPFVGGGALFMDVENSNVAINDLNYELINVYLVVRDHPELLISELKEHQKNHNRDYYYKVRDFDRQEEYIKMSNINKASRTIYLNRTCYNGLYRVNSKGYFNVPLGTYQNQDIVIKDKILKLSEYLNKSNVHITNQDFSDAVRDAKSGDLVYFDPPYDYELSDGFTSYTSNGFTRADLSRLKVICDELIRRGCKVIISNNDTPYVNSLFNDISYKIEHVITSWTISRDSNSRKEKREVIIHG